MKMTLCRSCSSPSGWVHVIVEKHNSEVELSPATVLVKEDSFNYIQRYRWKDVQRLTQTDKRVVISGLEEEGLYMILIEGPEDVLKAAYVHVSDIVEQARTTRFRMDSVSGVNTHVCDTVCDIEQRYKCVMTYKTTSPHLCVARKAGVETASSRKANRKATRIHAYLDEIQHTEADVIVNTTNTNLVLQTGGGVSPAIAKAGGVAIQAELKQNYPNGIQYGEVAVSGPGKMTNCKTVYHGALPVYKGYMKVQLEHCYGMLVLFILNCLNMATSQGYRSIAFPALGTGNLQYPLQNVVQLLYQTVRRYLDNNPRSSLEEVSFVVYPSSPPLIRKLFVMENLSNHLRTMRGHGIIPLHEDLQKTDRECCEARLLVENTFIQILNSDVKSVCDVTKNVLVLWTPNDVQSCGSNPFLACVDPHIQHHALAEYGPKITKSKCVVDRTSLPSRTVIHSVYNEDDVTCAVKGVVRGLKLAVKEGLYTLTIPVVADGKQLWQPHNAADIVVEAVKKVKPGDIIISVAIPSGLTFEPFVAMMMESTDRKLHLSPDTDTVLDTVWKSFSSRVHDTAPLGDAVLSVTSESEDTNLAAARKFEKRLGMKIVYTMEH